MNIAYEYATPLISRENQDNKNLIFFYKFRVESLFHGND